MSEVAIKTVISTNLEVSIEHLCQRGCTVEQGNSFCTLLSGVPGTNNVDQTWEIYRLKKPYPKIEWHTVVVQFSPTKSQMSIPPTGVPQ